MGKYILNCAENIKYIPISNLQLSIHTKSNIRLSYPFFDITACGYHSCNHSDLLSDLRFICTFEIKIWLSDKARFRPVPKHYNKAHKIRRYTKYNFSDHNNRYQTQISKSRKNVKVYVDVKYHRSQLHEESRSRTIRLFHGQVWVILVFPLPCNDSIMSKRPARWLLQPQNKRALVIKTARDIVSKCLGDSAALRVALKVRL